MDRKSLLLGWEAINHAGYCRKSTTGIRVGLAIDVVVLPVVLLSMAATSALARAIFAAVAMLTLLNVGTAHYEINRRKRQGRDHPE